MPYVTRALSVLVAVALHGAAYLVFATTPPSGSGVSGEQGVTIDLGMLGDLGEAEVTEVAQAVEAPQTEVEEPVEPQVEPEVVPPVEPEPVVEDVPTQVEPEPEIAPVEIAKVEEAVLAEVVETPKKQPKPKPEPIKPKPEPTPEPVKEAPKEPVVEPPKPKAAQVGQAQPSAAKQTSLAKSTGIGDSETAGGNEGVRDDYTAKIMALLQQHKRYPRAARRRGYEGSALLVFTLLPNGEVRDYALRKQTGYEVLDEATLAMLMKAGPFPRFPENLTEPWIRFQVPVSFKLKAD